MAAHNELGIWGEEVAVGYLQDHGYVILERDWHSGHHDIDIVAVDRAVSAGIGEEVLVAVGSSARIAAGVPNAPVDALIVGVVDKHQKD